MKARYEYRYVCPFCCKVVDPERFHRICRDPECVERFAQNCPAHVRNRRVSKFSVGREIDVERSIFNDIDPQSVDAITTDGHIVYPVKSTRCDVCGKELSEALCPICHSPVPPDAMEESNIISVLGAEKSGKSHYTAALIDVMKTSFCSEYDAEMRAAVPRTDEVFNILKSRLAEGDEGAECTSEPMVYYITMGPQVEKKVHTLALFDTAGADLESEGLSQSISTGTLITGSAGILFIVDPLSIPAVRRALRMPETTPTDPAKRLDEIADTIRLSRHQLGRDVDIPLAVIMTKVDALMRNPQNMEEVRIMFGPESALNVPRVRGTYDEENMTQVGAEVSEFLRRFLGEPFMDAVNRFTQHEFFAVSALGHDPSLHIKAEPFRVEDPMVWLFNRKKR